MFEKYRHVTSGLEDFYTRFIVGDGEHLKRKLQNFPVIDTDRAVEFRQTFLLSKVLVVAETSNGNVVAACGLRSIFNILTMYVEGAYRGRGIGTQVLKIAISKAQKRNLNFIMLTVLSNNSPALHLYLKFGFKEIFRLKSLGRIVMILPLSFKGRLAYIFLNAISSCRFTEVFSMYVVECVHKRTMKGRP